MVKNGHLAAFRKHALSCLWYTWKCLSACLMFWELLIWQARTLAWDIPEPQTAGGREQIPGNNHHVLVSFACSALNICYWPVLEPGYWSGQISSFTWCSCACVTHAIQCPDQPLQKQRKMCRGITWNSHSLQKALTSPCQLQVMQLPWCHANKSILPEYHAFPGLCSSQIRINAL